MNNILNLKNKTVLVTGASDGVGESVCKLISNLGARVIMVARREEKLRDIYKMLDGDGHACYSFDLSNIDEIELLVKKIVSENGKLDGIVHCAGVAVARPLRQMKYQVIHELMLVNFYSYFELVRVFSKKCNNNGSGSIVVMSSVSARSGDKAQSAYAASKAAIEGSVNVLAKELADKNIRINAITAGMIKTRMFENFLNRYDENSIEQLYNKQYLGVIDKENIAYAVAYLLSDASKFITGTGLVIDGGYLT